MKFKESLTKWGWWGDIAITAFALMALCCGGKSLCGSDHWIGWLAVGFVDLYIAIALLLAAILSDFKTPSGNNAEWLRTWLPHRTVAVAAIVLLTASMISGFAGLYMGDNMFMESSIPVGENGLPTLPSNKGATSESAPDTNPTRKSRLDALYISYQTLGFSDFNPKSTYCRKVVMFELASGMLLLIGAFSLLTSRLSNY